MIAKEKLNILWSLEQTAEKYADRVAVSDVNQELTWKELVKKAQIIGAELSEKVQPGNPVPVLLEKSSETLAVMLGNGEDIGSADCEYPVTETTNDGEYEIPYYKITPVAVTKENMDEVVIDGGFHTHEDVYLNVK